jgi:hypothetical protein
MNERIDQSFDQDGAADFLHVKPRTLEFWRASGQGPKYIRYSRRCVRYRFQDLIEFRDSRVVATDSAA